MAWVHYRPLEVQIQRHHELHSASSYDYSTYQADFDQVVDQNLPGKTEIATVNHHLDSYCSSDCQVDSHIAYHCCLGFEIKHLEEASCHSELQSFIGTSWELSLARPIAEHHISFTQITVVKTVASHHRYQAGMQITWASQFASWDSWLNRSLHLELPVASALQALSSLRQFTWGDRAYIWFTVLCHNSRLWLPPLFLAGAF